MNRRLVAVAVVFTVVFSAASLGSSLFQAGEVDADETVTRVDIDADGDGVFTLEVRTRLEDETELEGFERYQDDVENDTDEAISSFRGSITDLIEDASNTTERDMSAANFTVSTTIEPVPVRRGIVRYTFDWHGFANSTDDGIRAGDVLSGYILRGSDALVVNPPDGYAVNATDPSPDSTDGGVRWDGPRDFEEDQPRVVFVPETGTGGTTDGNVTGGTDGTADGTDTDGTDTGDGDATPATFVYAVAALAFVSLGAVAYVVASRRGGEDGDAGEGGEDRGEETAVVSDAESPSDSPAEARSPEPVEAAPPPSFEDLPDDERVLRIVESEDGRMKQKEVVQRTGWSEAKVSQVTSRLEDEGEIAKLSAGRENVIERRGGEENEAI